MRTHPTFALPVLSSRPPVPALSVNLKLVGSNCNMRCSYCYEHDNPRWALERLRPEEVATFIASVPPETELRFLLHGGEPLLYPKPEMARLLTTIVTAAGRRARVHLQSNGTLLDNDWIEMFLAHDPEFVFSLSIDSLRNDPNRKLPSRRLVPLLIEKLTLLKAWGARVGVVSVISRDNVDDFNDFMGQIVELGVRYLTVSKLRRNTAARAETNHLVLSEVEYVTFLERLLRSWIDLRLFRRIQIQPFMTLLSNASNRICTFEASMQKCDTFVSLYPGGVRTGCDHRGNGPPRTLPACAACPIASWCGGGCFGEEKDPTFCEARFRLKALVDAVSL